MCQRSPASDLRVGLRLGKPTEHKLSASLRRGHYINHCVMGTITWHVHAHLRSRILMPVLSRLLCCMSNDALTILLYDHFVVLTPSRRVARILLSRTLGGSMEELVKYMKALTFLQLQVVTGSNVFGKPELLL